MPGTPARNEEMKMKERQISVKPVPPKNVLLAPANP